MPLPEFNPLHIYRACLRECSYLPLPECRSYLKQFTTSKFREAIDRLSKSHDGSVSKIQSPRQGERRTLVTDTISQALHRARKHAALLRHANEGYLHALEKVLRMTWGRTGMRKYELLAKYIYPDKTFTSFPPPIWMNSQGKISCHGGDKPDSADDLVLDEFEAPPAGTGASDPSLLPTVSLEKNEAEDIVSGILNGKGLQDALSEESVAEPSETTTSVANSEEPTPSVTTFTELYKVATGQKRVFLERDPPDWKRDLLPHLEALIESQSSEQHRWIRVGVRRDVKTKFKPPPFTIWKKPLPLARYKNLRIKWYNYNLETALPPLETEEEYWALHDYVTGKRAIADPPRRRSASAVSEDDLKQKQLEADAAYLVEGPTPYQKQPPGNPHEITTQLLRSLLSRAVLAQTPLVKATKNPCEPETQPMGQNERRLLQAQAASGLSFLWANGLSDIKLQKLEELISEPLPAQQNDLLFG
jgi:hypothetical protein